MNLKQLQKTWDDFGKSDPLWAILTHEEKVNRGWKTEEFFLTGQEEISDVLKKIDQLVPRLPRRKALDFGCGIGRLTQALCPYFEQCHGVDIAPSMIKLARKYNRWRKRCRYWLNDADNLRLFPDNTFDFIYSNIVLQHMKPDYSKAYIGEFLRTLAPGGLIIFQLPTGTAPPAMPGNGSPQSESLPITGFQAQITGPKTIRCRPGTTIQIRARVKNISSVTWRAGLFSSIRLGNHWLDANGCMTIRDDGRAELPGDLNPGEQAELRLTVISPQEPGMYQLELDMVQEHVAWFRDRGSEPCRVRVKASRLVGWLLPRTQDDRMQRRGCVARMEMHGIPKEDVVDLLTAQGGKILSIDESDCLGQRWISHTYFVTK
jgi:SAM-dependent methyltransferase